MNESRIIEPSRPEIQGVPETYFHAYVDGFNLYKGILERRPELKWLDIGALCAARWPDQNLQRVYYFTARVKERFAGDDAPRRQHAYLRALSASGVEVVLGKFRKDPSHLRLTSSSHPQVLQPSLNDPSGEIQSAFDDAARRAEPDSMTAHVWKFGEKGSDVNLASHFLRDAFLKDLPAAMLITGDSDLSTPVAMAVKHGVLVKALIPHDPGGSVALRSAATYSESIHPRWLEQCQLRSTLRSANGKLIHRPREWQ